MGRLALSLWGPQVLTWGPYLVTFVIAFLQRRIKILIADVPEMSVRGRGKAAGHIAGGFAVYVRH
jgi:hypothetical protein